MGRGWGSGGGRFFAVFAVLLGIAVMPLLVTPVPPLVDYPNHLARIHLLAHLAAMPALRGFYEVAWSALPNLAFDGLGVVLAWVLPTKLAGTVVLLITLGLMAGGVVAVSRALRWGQAWRGADWFCLMSFLFLMSQPFYYGFIGSMLGVGLLLWAVALWLGLRDGPGWRLLLVGFVAGLVLYFAHLFALAVFGLVTGCVELQRLVARRGRGLGWSAVVLGVPMVVPGWLFLARSGTAAGATYWVRGWTDVLPILLSPAFTVDPVLDLMTMLAFAGVVVFGLVTRRLVVAPDMRLALVVLGVVSVAMPEMLASSYYAHLRLPAVVVLLLCASGRWTRRAGGDWLTLVGVVGLLALFCVRTAVLSEAFMQRGAFLDRLQVALSGVAPGTRLASTTVRSAEDGTNQLGWDHGICLEVIDRGAYVANVFTVPGQQPLRKGPAAAVLAPPAVLRAPAIGAPAMGGMAAEMFSGLDLFVLINPGAPHPVLPGVLQLVHRDAEFEVYRVGADDKTEQK